MKYKQHFRTAAALTVSFLECRRGRFQISLNIIKGVRGRNISILARPHTLYYLGAMLCFF